ncbi:MAG: AAA family ATPase [Erysipelotrichaceae bacterium]|nr:AAA family ATPase [Erysipelotrichaceae bacterium]
MKLNSIKIENFGILSNFNITFKNDFTKIVEKNGWGKSTLSDFICVMFYGFKDENKKNKNEREREKYRPWQGGDYGGTIVFETNNTIYSATRQFGSKDSEDIFVLKDLTKNIVSKDFSSNLGLELFDLDRESFERTIYIDRNGCQTSITTNMSAKLGNLIDNTDDINNFDSADSALKDLINTMTPNYKRGSIYKLKNEIYDLSVKTEDKNKILNQLETEEKEKEEKEKQLSEAVDLLEKYKNQQNKLSKYKDLQLKKQAFDDLQTSFENRKNILDRERLSFPAEVPDTKELNSYINKATELNNIVSEANAYKMADDSYYKYLDFKNTFESLPTSDTEINNYRKNVRRLKDEELLNANNKLDNEEENYINRYSPVFEKNIRDESYTGNLRNRWIERLKKNSNLNAKKQQLSIREGNTDLIFSIVFLIIAIGILAIDLVYGLVLKEELIQKYFILLLIAALVFISISLVFFINKNKKKKINKIKREEITREIKDDSKFINDVDSEVKNLLSGFGISFNEESVLPELDSIKSNYDRLIELKNRKEKYERFITDHERLSEINNVSNFIRRYISNTEYNRFENDLDLISNMFTQYKQLEDRNKKYDECNNKANVLKEDITRYLYRLGFEDVSYLSIKLEKIKEDLTSYLNSLNEYNEAKKQLNLFIENNDIEIFRDLRIDSELSIEELNDRISSTADTIDLLKTDLININSYLEDIRESYDNIVEDENLLLEKKERIREEKQKYDLIELTRKLLNEAKSSFVNKYVGPITNSFRNYYETATSESSNIFTFDTNAKLTYEEHGLEREENTLSSGYQDVVGLCTRIALVDTMFTNEKPFIILDDPFTNLDKDKLDGSMKLLDKLSEQYQIVYFTCHDSRS